MLPVTKLLPRFTKSTSSIVAWAAIASFTTYFCMFAFRKGISAATFEGVNINGFSFKSALVIAQVLGYMTSKFIGIKFISEIDRSKRGRYILLLLLSAHLCLLLLALVPVPFNVIFLYFNGICVGMIWGLVFSFIEGRRFTDFIALVVSTNFIFSSGAVKSLGRMSIEKWGIPEIYMPFFVGLLFIPLLFLAVWMLNKIPPPEAEEIESRGKRVPLKGAERMLLFRQFLPGLVAITVVNLVLTILRDVKDNFAVEILRLLKPSFNPSIFTQMETTAAVSVFFLLLILAGFRNHFKSIIIHHFTILAGLILVVFTTWLIREDSIDPVFTLIIYTIGLYVCYNTLQCLFLDRFIAAFGMTANIGFFFYLMDSIGYMGSCFVILNKEVFNTNTNWLIYFINASFTLGTIGIISILVSMVYFYRKYKRMKSPAGSPGIVIQPATG